MYISLAKKPKNDIFECLNDSFQRIRGLEFLLPCSPLLQSFEFQWKKRLAEIWLFPEDSIFIGLLFYFVRIAQQERFSPTRE
jgi:hypothetical protein